METHRKSFRLNRSDGKVMGVCAGIADHFEVDVTLVRIAMALSILMTFPVVLIGYFVLAAMTDQDGRQRQRNSARAPRLSPATADSTRQRMRDLDARVQAIETYVTSSNTSLAREIDELR